MALWMGVWYSARFGYLKNIAMTKEEKHIDFMMGDEYPNAGYDFMAARGDSDGGVMSDFYSFFGV